MTMILTNLTVQDVRGSNTGGRYAVLGQISVWKKRWASNETERAVGLTWTSGART